MEPSIIRSTGHVLRKCGDCEHAEPARWPAAQPRSVCAKENVIENYTGAVIAQSRRYVSAEAFCRHRLPSLFE